MKVLVLSCSTGGGHNACAKYIEEELRDNKIEAIYEDFYDIVNASAKELSSKIYLSTVTGNGEIFKNVYKLGELYSKTGIKSPVYLVNKLHKKRLYNYIIENNFDLVITSHLFPALTLTAINKGIFPKRVNFIMVATDYEPCPFLEETKPNYLIMQKGSEDRFIEKGFEKEILINSGIPVSSRFIEGAKDIRDNFDIKGERVILVMLGSMGFGKIDEVIQEILQINNIKVLVVCGTNKKLYERLKEIGNNKLIPLGFVDNMNDLIYSSDVVLSKPGGLSSTEVASINKPLLHIFPIPGIETYNTKFFEDMGMSIKCDKKEEIMDNVKRLLEDEKLQHMMVSNQKKYINKNSASELVELVKRMK